MNKDRNLNIPTPLSVTNLTSVIALENQIRDINIDINPKKVIVV